MNKTSDALEMAKRLAEKAATHKPKISEQFKKHFAAVTAHYRCDADEVKLMKQSVMQDIPAAEKSFEAMYEELKDNSATGINERIRKAIDASD